MFCGKCGAQMPDHVKFCTKCGYKFQTTAAVPPAASPASNAPLYQPTPAAQAYNQTPPAPVYYQAPAAPEYDPAPVVSEIERAIEADEGLREPAAQAVAETAAAPAYDPAHTAPVYNQPPIAPAYNQPPAAPVYTPPAAGPTGYYPGRGPAAAERSGFEAVRRMGSSPVALVAIIAFTLSLLFNLIICFQRFETASAVDKIVRENDLSKALLGGVTGSAVTGAVMNLISVLVFSGLMALGMWLAYAATKKRTGPFSTSGLTTIKVLTIIELVFICIGFAILTIVLLASGMLTGKALSELSNLNRATDGVLSNEIGSASGAIAGVFVVFLVFSVVFMVLTILYYAGIIKTINSMRQTMTRGVPGTNVSLYVAVVNFILAAGKLLSLAVTRAATDLLEKFLDQVIVSGGTGADLLAWLGVEERTALMTGQEICTCISLVCFGIFLFQYKAAMRDSRTA